MFQIIRRLGLIGIFVVGFSSAGIAATKGGGGSTVKTGATFTETAPSVYNRAYHTATRLLDGRVLITGGSDLAARPSSAEYMAEIFDPVTESFRGTGEMHEPRQGHVAVLMKDGRVLVTGGSDGSGKPALTSEIYDPKTGTFESLGADLITPRTGQFAFSMPDGRVLILGGLETFLTYFVNSYGNVNAWNRPIREAQLFDPVTKTVSTTGSLVSLGRDSYNATATQLPDGRVVVIGGLTMALHLTWHTDPQWRRYDDAEIYDPTTGEFTVMAGKMAAARYYHSATILPNGKILIAGGNLSNNATQQPIENFTNSAEVFDPATQQFSSVGSLAQGRARGISLTLMPTGKVLVVGGLKNVEDYFHMADIAELFDPVTGKFSRGPKQARTAHSAVQLLNGKVLISGGRLSNISLGSLLYK